MNSKSEASMIKNEKEPLICSLTNVELKERKKTIEKFKSMVYEKNEIENGIVFKLEGADDNLESIMNLVKLERKCCTFLTFDLRIQKDAYPLQVTISGPEGTRDFLIHELGL
ncbi:MAG: hypothetical protein J7604_22500 [Sporocytophaga sp.]|uniref:hypothetical protein n=1 Tax=Sporocytophaga sp. TaxID=2231183 RepID=UPI001B035642|nr:hypothetical protein [Sporocytophaga sp.]MBO9703002.1 hypothetical protein [Sporocytophaga sp.]